MAAFLIVQLFLSSLLLFFTFKHFFFKKSPSADRKKLPDEPPQPAGRLPVLGHLLLLGWRRPVAFALGDLADKYGPIFTLWIGSRRVLAVSNWEIAKECLTTHDKALADRPRVAAGKFIGYDNLLLAIAPYGMYWRQVKKLVTLRLLSTRHLEQVKHVWGNEINLSIHHLYQNSIYNRNLSPVDLKKWLSDLTFNIVSLMVVGKRYYGEGIGVEDEVEAAKFRVAMEKALFLTGNMIPSDGVPWMERLDLGGYIKTMKWTMKELDSIVSGWVEAHRKRRNRDSGEASKTQDFIDVLLDTMDENPIPECDIEVAIKAILVNILLAGTDTTSVSLTWAVSLLANHKQILKIAQAEMDELVGKDRNVEESDIRNLPYLQAIYKETLRLYPSAPIGVPHESREDLCIFGYHIPAGTMLIFNFWKIQRDPTVWEEPSKFEPERFLVSSSNQEVDNMVGQNFQFMPFGGGRRVCPGNVFAIQVAHLTLARIIHGFNLEIEGNELVDMSEGYGVTMPKTTPLKVILKPRLSSHLYTLN